MVGALVGIVLCATLEWDPVEVDVEGSPETVVESEVEAVESGSGQVLRAVECGPVSCALAGMGGWIRGGDYSLRARVFDAAGNSSEWSEPIAWRPEVFLRGDANDDSRVDIADAVYALRILFLGGTPTCFDAIDSNDDGRVDVADPIRLLVAMFGDASAGIPEPWPQEGLDPTVDELRCAR